MAGGKTIERTPEMVFLRKWHLIVGLIVAILVPAISLTASYYNNQQAIDQRLSRFQLDAERRFAKKDELSALSSKIDRVLNEVSEIKGYMRSQRRNTRNRNNER